MSQGFEIITVDVVAPTACPRSILQHRLRTSHECTRWLQGILWHKKSCDKQAQKYIAESLKTSFQA